MKKISFVITACILLLQLSASAQNSFLRIKIKDSDNLNLPGASVVLKPGNIFGVTDQQGELLLSGIKPGKYTIAISYIGYDNIEKPVAIENAGSSIIETLKPLAAIGKEVVVLGDRLKGQAKALNQQKNSDNISNIVSSDQIGRFPDANIGDAIKRVPGITMQNDQGEARNIIVRGMGPEFNAVSLNGERIPSAEGDNRRVQMDLITADMVQTVEVSKTLTADMDADAIGGSVNLITRSAPNGLRVSGTVSGGYNGIRDGFIGNANLMIGTRTHNQKFGFVLNGSFNNNTYGSDNIEAAWSKDANGRVFVSDHDQRVYNVTRVRRNLSGTIDYRIDNLNSIGLTGTYNWRDDRENRFRLRHRYRGDAEDYADDLVYNTAGDIVSYKNGEVLRQTKGGLDNSRNKSARLEDQRVRTLALKGDHVWGQLRVNWNAQYARASEKRPDERYISMGRRNITVNQDISNPELPLLTDETALGDYTRFNELTNKNQNQFEEDLNARIKIELPLSLFKNQQGSLYFGGRLRHKLKERENNFFSYKPLGDNKDKYNNIALLPLSDKTNNHFSQGSQFAAGQFVDAKFLGGLNLTDPSLFKETDEPAEYLAGNYKAKETISAGYIGLRQNITEQLSFNAGVRVEHTSINYTGNIVEDEEYLKGTAALKNTYTDVLPSINLKYKLNNSAVLKAAFTKSIARPKYYDLVPYFNINPNDLELSAGNPSLEPVRATNIDLMLERYFKTVGLVSGGIFYKRVNDFFYTALDYNYTQAKFNKDFSGVNNPIGANESWRFTQRRNGTGADVMGAEVAFQRQLDFLPGFWKGFGLYLNYTYTYSKTEGIYIDGEKARSDVKLPGAAPHMFNASLSWENKRAVVRLSGNFTSSYVDDSDDAGYTEDSFTDRFYDKQFFLDANASYAITPKWRVFAEANNLTNQQLRYFQGVRSRTAQSEFYGRRYVVGLKFDISK
ncbi:MAG: TonB-dependent receptor [Chitinophagaceae bacterium]|nr:TonB-dependent receptor [Chitinophagaceae bacterium]